MQLSHGHTASTASYLLLHSHLCDRSYSNFVSFFSLVAALFIAKRTGIIKKLCQDLSGVLPLRIESRLPGATKGQLEATRRLVSDVDKWSHWIWYFGKPSLSLFPYLDISLQQLQVFRAQKQQCSAIKFGTVLYTTWVNYIVYLTTGLKSRQDF